MKDEVLATCHLGTIRPGLLRGTVTFPVRGTFQVSLELQDRMDNGAWRALLRVGRDRAEVHQRLAVPAGFFDDMPEGDVEHWWTEIRVEGYAMGFRGVATDGGMSVQFIDTTQPLPLREDTHA